MTGSVVRCWSVYVLLVVFYALLVDFYVLSVGFGSVGPSVYRSVWKRRRSALKEKTALSAKLFRRWPLKKLRPLPRKSAPNPAFLHNLIEMSYKVYKKFVFWNRGADNIRGGGGRFVLYYMKQTKQSLLTNPLPNPLETIG